MGDTNRSASASGVITESLQLVKQTFGRLLTDLREVAQKGNNWPQIEPAINRLDATTANFFTKPEAAVLGEVKSQVGRHFSELREITQKADIAPAILPFVAGAEGMMTTFLEQWKSAH